MDHPVDVGQKSEAIILAELVKRDYRVLLPFGINHRYDLVIDDNGSFARAQCKTGRLHEGKILFNSVSTQSNSKGSKVVDYLSQIDIFLVYCPELDRVYRLPVEEVPCGKPYLRVDPPKNGQVRGVRWAKDFELPLKHKW